MHWYLINGSGVQYYIKKDLEILTQTKDDVTILHLKGDVTAATRKVVEDAYQKASMTGTKKILLFFDKENYINSGGIASLILIASESKKWAQKILITGIVNHYKKIFEMSGLLKYIKFYPSEEAALAGFD